MWLQMVQVLYLPYLKLQYFEMRSQENLTTVQFVFKYVSLKQIMMQL